MLSIDDRVLGCRLGLGDLDRPSRGCWGYEHCCDCDDCKKRDELLLETGSSVERVEAPAQPWEVAA